MVCGKTLEELVPLIAAVKLSTIDGIKQMSDQDLVIKYSEIMWDLETAYTYVREHGGLTWTGE